ncbi:MAG: hypothetical protein IJS87_07235 [Rhodocyclaceae bacterium]|nr:hypothetical protein [Rhodocyclaceae bacterium]
MAPSRFLARVGILAVALSLTACGGDESDEAEKIRQNTAAESFSALTAGSGSACSLNDGSTLAFDSDGNLYADGGVSGVWDYEVTRSLLSSFGYTFPNGVRQYITTLSIPGGLNMNVRTQQLDGSGNVKSEATASGNCHALRGDIPPYSPTFSSSVLNGMTCINHVRLQSLRFNANVVSVIEDGRVVAQAPAAELFDGTGVQLQKDRIHALAFDLGGGFGTYLDVRYGFDGTTSRFPCGM